MIFSESIVLNIIAVIAIILFIGSLVLPKVWKYIVYGIFLVSMGSLPILYSQGHISFNPLELAIFQYLLLIIVILSGRELIVEGIKEEGSIIRWISIILGLALIIITTIPTLYNLGAITFKMPEIPEITLNILYILSGIILMGGLIVTRNSD